MDREVMEWLVQGSNNSIGVIAAAAAGAGCASINQTMQGEETARGRDEGREDWGGVFGGSGEDMRRRRRVGWVEVGEGNEKQ